MVRLEEFDDRVIHLARRERYAVIIDGSLFYSSTSGAKHTFGNSSDALRYKAERYK